MPENQGEVSSKAQGDVTAALREFVKLLEQRGAGLSALFQAVLQHPAHVAFARQHYRGLPGEVVAGERQAECQTLWEPLLQQITLLCDEVVLRTTSFFSPEEQVQWGDFLLCVEGFLNAILCRQVGAGCPQICWGSAVSYFAQEGKSHSGVNCQINVLSDGIVINWVGAMPKRRRFENSDGLLKVTRPFRVTSLAASGRTVSAGLLQFICKAFPDPAPTSAPHKFSEWLELLRYLQQEVCLATEEWEFRNSVLAVTFTQAREQILRQPAGESASEAHSILAHVAQSRDELAFWFCWSLTEIQEVLANAHEYLSEEKGMGPGVAWAAGQLEDLKAEWEAAQLACLAAVQKLFLPASVSRHDYHPEVLSCAHDWAVARGRCAPDDFSAQLCQLAFLPSETESGFFTRAKSLLSSIHSQSSLDWFLSFDPSAALKAFCWARSRAEHAVVSLLLAELLAVKMRSSDGFDAYWSSVLVGTLQMPETFPLIREQWADRRSVEKPLCSNDFFQLFEKTEQLLCESSPEAEDLRKLWREFGQSFVLKEGE